MGHLPQEGAGQVHGREVFPQLREREAWTRDLHRDSKERHGGVQDGERAK